MQNIDEFIESILNDKGIETPDEETRNQLKEDMKNRLLDQIDRAAIQALPEDKAAELAEKIDKPDFTNDDMVKFVQESGVDLAEVALETMLQFRNFYLGTED